MNKTFVVINLSAGVEFATIVTNDEGENAIWFSEEEAAYWAVRNLGEFSVVDLFSW